MVVNSRLQDLLDGHTQPLPVLETQTPDRTRGAQPGEKEALARINIPHPHYYCRVHHKVLHGFVESLSARQEICTGKRLREWLWSRMRQAARLKACCLGA